MDGMHNRKLNRIFATITGLALLAGLAAAQDTGKRGRKYKALPATAHIEVLVQKPNGKPLMNAAVIFHPVKDGRDEGNLEMKTDSDGKAVIEVIQIGSQMRVQVIANGYATFGDDYDIPTDTKNIVITMKRPVDQYSTYGENGQRTTTTPGVQELPPKAKAVPQTPGVLPITVPPQTAPASTPQN
jgi:hypothetical protein